MGGQGGANPAGITGVVTDNTGAVLPGVTVTATSPAPQVTFGHQCLERAGRVPIAASDRSLTAERSLAENVDEAVSRRRSPEPS